MSSSNRISSEYKGDLNQITKDISQYQGVKKYLHRTVKVKLKEDPANREQNLALRLFKKIVSNENQLYFDRDHAISWLKDRGVKITGKEDLNSLMTQHLSDEIIHKHMTANFDRILEKHNRLNKGFIDPQTLKNIVKSAVSQAVSGSSSGSIVVDEESQRKFLAGFRNKKLYLRDITNVKKLGTGSFGVAEEVKSVTSGKLKAIKWASPLKESDRSFAVSSLQREYRILHILHKAFGGKIPGIQKPPSSIISLNGPEEEKKVGILSFKYDGEMIAAVQASLFPNIEEKMRSFTPLFEGMSFCAEHNLVHRDIKPSNIFFEKTEDNKIKLYIGDFGGALLTNEHKDLSNISFTLTPSHVSFEDSKLMDKFSETNNAKGLFELYKKADVFAMGCTLAYLLTGNKPVMSSYSEGGYPNGPLKIAPLKEKGVPEEVIQFLLKLTDSDHKKRPSMSEALTEWKSLVAKYAPEKKETFSISEKVAEETKKVTSKLKNSKAKIKKLVTSFKVKKKNK